MTETTNLGYAQVIERLRAEVESLRAERQQAIDALRDALKWVKQNHAHAARRIIEDALEKLGEKP